MAVKWDGLDDRGPVEGLPSWQACSPVPIAPLRACPIAIAPQPQQVARSIAFDTHQLFGSAMYDFCFTPIYAFLLALGGVVGFVTKGSTASLGAGWLLGRAGAGSGLQFPPPPPVAYCLRFPAAVVLNTSQWVVADILAAPWSIMSQQNTSCVLAPLAPTSAPPPCRRRRGVGSRAVCLHLRLTAGIPPRPPVPPRHTHLPW